MVQRIGGLLLASLVVVGCGNVSASTAGPQTPSSPVGAPATNGAARPVAEPAAATVPVLLPDRDMALDRGAPAALRAHFALLGRRALARARKAAAAPRTAAGGCAFASPTMAGPTPPKAWLPRPPADVQATVLGRQVRVDVTLPASVPSLGCRTAGVTIVVSSGANTTFQNMGGIASYSLLDGRSALLGRTVRLVGRIPYLGRPPYHLSVNTQTVVGLRSTYVDMTLRCPDDGACLDGERPNPGGGLPAPHLPLRGTTPEQLGASLRQVLQGESTWVRATGATCTSTRTCTADFFDTVARARLRIRYVVQGEQRPGCWFAAPARGQASFTARPGFIAPSAAGRLGGCVDWLG